MTIRYIVLSVASVVLVGCHWVPSTSYTVPPVEDQLPDVHYHKAEKPDLEKSKLFGIPKLHPGWLTGFYPMSPPPEWKPSWPDWWRGGHLAPKEPQLQLLLVCDRRRRP
jgi:hypothetical protein